MDLDSHRYLECFFAIPMLGAILQTVNIRLSTEQVLYTLNHARPTLLLVNTEFLPLLKEIGNRLESISEVILMVDDSDSRPEAPKPSREYEGWLASMRSHFDYPDLNEKI